jgi:hypothetical protein
MQARFPVFPGHRRGAPIRLDVHMYALPRATQCPTSQLIALHMYVAFVKIGNRK